MENSITLPTIYPVACHTDNVGPGSAYVAIKGDTHDGADFIPLALDKGADMIVVQRNTKLSTELRNRMKRTAVRLMWVDNPREMLAVLSALAASLPATRLCVIGVTGTKGKTTSTFLLAHLLEAAGFKVAMLSGVKNRILGQEFSTTLTTQHPDYIQQFFKVCVEQGVTHVVMEVAAQAASLHRVAGMYFDGLLFTNFSQEHGEFYRSMDEYFAAKRSLFSQRVNPKGVALVNGDDAACAPLAMHYDYCHQFSRHHDALVRGEVTGTAAGVHGTMKIGSTTYVLDCPALTGDFNATNVLGAAGMAAIFRVSPEDITRGLQSFAGVPGRLERHTFSNGASCYIDYAHNPSSYEAVLSTLRPMTDHLIVVFGAGGDREAGKRPIMGTIAANYADVVVLTSDNPRSEDPAAIIDAITAGISAEQQHKVIREVDRALAIRKAYERSRAGSVVVLLGKGPDEYQIVGTTKTPFSEAAIIRSL